MKTTEPRDVVVLAGDEALLGRPASVADLSAWQDRVAGTEVWADGGWGPMFAAPAVFVGPELALAELHATETARPLGILKMAVPGSSLTGDWHGQTTSDLLDRLVGKLRAVMHDGPVRVRGLIWYQGAADLTDNRKARVYDTWLGRMIARLRAAVGVPDLPVLTVVPPRQDGETAARTALRRALSRQGDGRFPIAAGAPVEDDGCLPAAGLASLGRRAGHLLLGLDGAVPGADRQRRWLWNDDRHQVWIEGPHLRPGAALVTFPFVSAGDGFNDPAYAQSLAVSRGLTSIHLRASRNDWFQTDSFAAMAQAIRAAIPNDTRLVTYGSSMGGFGALLFSGALRAERVIAIAPQVSIDRAVVPFENRWSRAAAEIGPFRHRLADHVARDGQKLILYDPLSDDAKHVALMPKDRGIAHLRLPFAAHHVGEYLAETNALEMLVQDVLGQGPKPRAILRRVRINRRRSKFYWQGRADALAARGHPMAEHAIARLEDLGSSDRKLRTLRETLNKTRGAPAAH
ncbi:sialate O-acetylesterase [Anianabacter salinae]|uniref:sialate O-acetylesterase n=1 Tax=Anianabacter salinae TaxID=2851023 RepID=UPI00225DED9F|nr:sialate O-acetylesterase [Anianabacter salinae]MBV0913695.1 sialate O-acetylesterase [Anianabacter salinae]